MRRTAEPRVVAVLVAYQRRDLLVEALQAVLAQDRRPDVVVVVDNASTDGSAQAAATVAKGVEGVDVVVLARNTGGAGGFAVGLARAIETHGADLVWLMDDDTVPTPTALEHLAQTWARAHGPAAVASRVVWVDGTDHPMNSPRRRPGATRAAVRSAAELGCLPVRSASFVSLLLDADAVRGTGLPMAAFFIWNDDFEFTTRLLRDRSGLFCPASVVVHKTRAFGATDADPGARFYYEVRNKVWTFTRSRGLRPVEKLVYGGSTVQRWARTMRGSSDRALLLGCLRRGLADGLRRAPEPTASVLADLGPVSDDVARLERRRDG